MAKDNNWPWKFISYIILRIFLMALSYSNCFIARFVSGFWPNIWKSTVMCGYTRKNLILRDQGPHSKNFVFLFDHVVQILFMINKQRFIWSYVLFRSRSWRSSFSAIFFSFQELLHIQDLLPIYYCCVHEFRIICRTVQHSRIIAEPFSFFFL